MNNSKNKSRRALFARLSKILCLIISLNFIVLPNFTFTLCKSDKKLEKLRIEYFLDEEIKNIDGVAMRKKLKKLLKNPTIIKYLATIAKAEGGESNLMVGGCRVKNLKKHPAEVLPKSCRFPIKINGKWEFASSSGLYQITYQNWLSISKFLELKDFLEENQALAALELIRRGGGAANAKTEKGLRIKNQIQEGFLALINGKGNLKKGFRLATYDYASSKDSPLPVPPGFKKINYWLLSKK